VNTFWWSICLFHWTSNISSLETNTPFLHVYRSPVFMAKSQTNQNLFYVSDNNILFSLDVLINDVFHTSLSLQKSFLARCIRNPTAFCTEYVITTCSVSLVYRGCHIVTADHRQDRYYSSLLLCYSYYKVKSFLCLTNYHVMMTPSCA